MRKVELSWLLFGLGLLTFGAFFWTRESVRCEKGGGDRAECRVSTARRFGTAPGAPLIVAGVTEATSLPVERSSTDRSQTPPSYRAEFSQSVVYVHGG